MDGFASLYRRPRGAGHTHPERTPWRLPPGGGFELPPLMFSVEETLAVSSACWRCAVRPGRKRAGLGKCAGQAEQGDARCAAAPRGAHDRQPGSGPRPAGTSVAALVTPAEAAQVRARVEFRYRDPQGAEPSANSIPTAWPIATAAGTCSGFATCARRCVRSVSIAWTRRACWRSVRATGGFRYPPPSPAGELRPDAARLPGGNPDAGGEEGWSRCSASPLGLLAEVDGGTLLRASTDDLDWFAGACAACRSTLLVGSRWMREPLRPPGRACPA